MSVTRIGGPGTCIPRPIEAFLAWSLCISCLTVSGYHYIKSTIAPKFLQSIAHTSTLLVYFLGLQNERCKISGIAPECSLSICVHSRKELDRCSPLMRYQQLIQYLEAKKLWNTVIRDQEALLKFIRKDNIGRRLVSLAMRPYTQTVNGVQLDMAIYLENPKLPLAKDLLSVYPRLLILPSLIRDSTTRYDISVIIPAHNESAKLLQKSLSQVLTSCSNPKRVEIIIVDTGGSQDNFVGVVHNFKERSSWGNISIVNFQQGGGRGPTLNAGAAIATGFILTFLHIDTTLPYNWDQSIIEILTDENCKCRASACAFGFGIDTSAKGLSNPFDSGGESYLPPGISAVKTTANIRTHLYSLPYGDQCISLPRVVYEYIGGFPDQCLMEDYEIVSLLRKRAIMIKLIAGNQTCETIKIIRESALCSPRRWQKFGVLYVTYMNSKFVNLYARGLSPDDVYRMYYCSEPPTRNSEFSPWEIDLASSIQNLR